MAVPSVPHSLSENMKGLKNNVQIQLCQIYCKDQKFGTQNFVTVKIPEIQQQPNSYDCRIFALASLVDFCFNPATFNFRTCYLVNEMRLHLLNCLEKRLMSPFPREQSRCRGTKLSTVNPKSLKIAVWCHCKLPEFVDDMVCCEGRKCKQWFHKKCIGLNKSLGTTWQYVSCGHLNN